MTRALRQLARFGTSAHKNTRDCQDRESSNGSHIEELINPANVIRACLGKANPLQAQAFEMTKTHETLLVLTETAAARPYICDVHDDVCLHHARAQS